MHSGFRREAAKKGLEDRGNKGRTFWDCDNLDINLRKEKHKNRQVAKTFYQAFPLSDQIL